MAEEKIAEKMASQSTIDKRETHRPFSFPNLIPPDPFSFKSKDWICLGLGSK